MVPGDGLEGGGGFVLHLQGNGGFGWRGERQGIGKLPGEGCE